MTRIHARHTTAAVTAALLALAGFTDCTAARAAAPNEDTATDRQDRVTGTQGGGTLIIQHRSRTTGDRTTIVTPAPSEGAQDEGDSRTPIVVFPEVEISAPPQRPKPPIIYRPGQ